MLYAVSSILFSRKSKKEGAVSSPSRLSVSECFINALLGGQTQIYGQHFWLVTKKTICFYDYSLLWLLNNPFSALLLQGSNALE